jgi:translation initiation factor 2B subunit (eIF-2B alpha/beta/delta family)
MKAAIASALITALTELEDFQRDGQYHAEYVEQLMSSLVDERRAMTAELSKVFAAYVKHEVLIDRREGDDGGMTLRILTLSASSTIRESLLHLLNTTTDIHAIDLRILESRPLFEGVGLASSILSSYQNRESSDNDEGEDNCPKLHVTLYTDASAALASAGIHLLLLGADRVTADGGVSNKTGSLPAVLAAKHVSPQAKVVVLSEVDKVAGPNGHSEESNQPAEVMRGWREAAAWGTLEGLDAVDATAGRGSATVAVAVKNIYFEQVPPSLVDIYITNEGIKEVSDIQRRSKWVEEQIRRFFDDL